MISGKRWARSVCVGAAVFGMMGAPALVEAESWRYGVMTDTQGAGASYPQVSTRLMEPVVDRFVNEHEIDMMLHVGDLTNDGTREEKQLWLDTAAPIYDAGIPVAVSRGNHDRFAEEIITDGDGNPIGTSTEIWDEKIPVPSTGNYVDGPGASHYFSYKNMFAISIDVAGAPPEQLIGWLQGVALPAAADSGTDHRVLVQHEPYFGKARQHVLGGQDELQISLIKGMSEAGIDAIYHGHDHQYSRSVAVDPEEGDVLLNHIVTGSNSEKYYRFEETPNKYERQAVQVNDRVSYSIVDVNGPMVEFKHFTSFAPDPSNTDPWTPDWELTDRMVYMTNGDQYYVGPNELFFDMESTSDNGTVAAITVTNSTFHSQMTDPDPGEGPGELVEFGNVVNMGWMSGADEDRVLSDILVLDGLAVDPAGVQTDNYRLELHYDETEVDDESLLMIAYFDEETESWLPAIQGNITPGLNAVPVSTLDDGVNMEENYVWAELNHNASGTQFAVVAIPEPTSLALFGLGGLALLRRRGTGARRRTSGC